MVALRRVPPGRRSITVRIPELTANDIGRFWAKVDRTGKDACWPWTAAASVVGYGRFKIEGRAYSPHRIAYQLAHGALPRGTGFHGVVVRHTCDNPRCCNPAHLVAGTQADNVADMVMRGRKAVDRGEDHHWTRYSEEESCAIRDYPASIRKTAAVFGCSSTYVSNLRLGKCRRGEPDRAGRRMTPALPCPSHVEVG